MGDPEKGRKKKKKEEASVHSLFVFLSQRTGLLFV